LLVEVKQQQKQTGEGSKHVFLLARLENLLPTQGIEDLVVVAATYQGWGIHYDSRWLERERTGSILVRPLVLVCPREHRRGAGCWGSGPSRAYGLESPPGLNAA